MRSSLVELGRALIGEVGMSNELDEVARSLFNGQIPSIWRALAPDTLKNLSNWMGHFRARLDQYTNWVEKGTGFAIHQKNIFSHKNTTLKQSSAERTGVKPRQLRGIKNVG